MGASRSRREVNSLGAEEDGMGMLTSTRMYRTSAGKIHAPVPSCRVYCRCHICFLIPECMQNHPPDEINVRVKNRYLSKKHI